MNWETFVRQDVSRLSTCRIGIVEADHQGAFTLPDAIEQLSMHSSKSKTGAYV